MMTFLNPSYNNLNCFSGSPEKADRDSFSRQSRIILKGESASKTNIQSGIPSSFIMFTKQKSGFQISFDHTKNRMVCNG